jgi:hypothetical protein
LEKEKLCFYNGGTTLSGKMTGRMQAAECWESLHYIAFGVAQFLLFETVIKIVTITLFCYW